MKKILRFILALFVVIISTGVATSQTLHKITLNVNTAEITDANMATTCNFGQPAGISNEDFTIAVEVGDRIVWDIKATDDNPLFTEFVFIKRTGGAKLLNKNKLSPIGNVVSAQVTKGKKNEEEKYEVKFKVRGKGTFTIDPKIVIKT